VADGKRVALGKGVVVGEAVGVRDGGKNWFASGSPTSAEATLNENRKSARRSHFQPAII
jgi:hypothetical protein